MTERFAFRGGLRWPDAWALGWLSLMAILPFLHAHHRNPIPSFFPEWWAILFGLLAALAFLAQEFIHDLRIPSVVFLPLALAGIILLQLPLVANSVADVSLLGVLFLLWAALLTVLGATLANRVGLPCVLNTLAASLTLGAAASVIVMALQATRTLTDTGLISVSPLERLFGNLNQPNHLGVQLWLGVTSVIYLQSQRKVRLSLALLAVSSFAIASLLTGSRAVIAYAFVLPVLLLIARKRMHLAHPRSVLLLGVWAMAVTLIGQLLQQTLPTLAPNARDWVVATKSSDGVRLGLWWTASQLGWDHLWGGIGWGRFASTSFMHMESLSAGAPISMTVVPGEHAHNILLNLWAETGLWGPVILLGLSYGWVRRVWRGGAHRLTVLLLLLPVALHAQLEYTLWYAFFLGPTALLLGGADSSWRPPKEVSRVLAGLIFSAALALAVTMRHDYARLERAMNWPGGEATALTWDEVKTDLLALRQHSRFGAYVDLSFAAALPLDRDQLAAKQQVCQAAIRFSPTDYAVFKCAAIDAMAGNPTEAEHRLTRAILAYPDHLKSHLELWRALLKDTPELAPLIAQGEAFLARRAASRQPLT